ncbi:hypothetical protein ACFQE1_03315 [Halobium palmae]|uniref:DUF8186 domain-containing protein n=1 Tax=Halobium palmae TaxID=1776492 RepID=A0ABD5RVF6_9EURY
MTLTVLNRSEETVTVRAMLRDANSSEPIDTSHREGSLVLAGERVETDETGAVTRTVDRDSAVTGRYEPGRWWVSETGYVGDSDVVHVRGTEIPLVSTLYRAGIPVLLFLLAVFLIDRITGWRIWPPWRGL